jgi:4-carboxymuconolactone decarboxylase
MMKAMAPADLSALDQRGKEILAQIAGPRGGHISSLFQMMMHSPPVTAGWSGFGNAIRFETHIDDRTRELVVLTAAHKLSCSYEWKQHETLALEKGMSAEEVEAITTWPSQAAIFNEDDRAVIELVQMVVDGVDVRGSSPFDLVVAERGESGLIELIAAACYYVAIARFVMALGIEP